MSGRLLGKIAVVTGSSRGIGAAISDCFAMEGATVIGVARTASKRKGENYLPMDVDLGSLSVADLGKFVGSIIERHGRIDVLVNNAGIIRRGPVVDSPEADWNDVIRVNLTTPYFLSQAVARWWIKAGGREKSGESARLKIINIASMLSFQGGILVSSYCASKHGIAGVTKALANEWASQRINVNAVAPGYVDTENTAPLKADPVRNAAILGRIPQGHWAAGSDIAGCCLFLASGDADYMNGAVINVDGGWLAR
jgi:2-deoxy-D-gluconate 3-dehydrogenase